MPSSCTSASPRRRRRGFTSSPPARRLRHRRARSSRERTWRRRVAARRRAFFPPDTSRVGPAVAQDARAAGQTPVLNPAAVDGADRLEAPTAPCDREAGRALPLEQLAPCPPHVAGNPDRSSRGGAALLIDGAAFSMFTGSSDVGTCPRGSPRLASPLSRRRRAPMGTGARRVMGCVPPLSSLRVEPLKRAAHRLTGSGIAPDRVLSEIELARRAFLSSFRAAHSEGVGRWLGWRGDGTSRSEARPASASANGQIGRSPSGCAWSIGCRGLRAARALARPIESDLARGTDLRTSALPAALTRIPSPPGSRLSGDCPTRLPQSIKLGAPWRRSRAPSTRIRSRRCACS
jgi:hypothetical protein